MIHIYVDLRRYQNIATKMRFVLVVIELRIIQALYIAQRELHIEQRPAAWYKLLLNEA